MVSVSPLTFFDNVNVGNSSPLANGADTMNAAMRVNWEVGDEGAGPREEFIEMLLLRTISTPPSWFVE